MNEVLINVCSNFKPNRVKTIRPSQVGWIAQNIKTFFGKKNHAYKSFVKKGEPADMLEGIQNMTTEGSKLVEDAKQKYFAKIGDTLSNPSTGSKLYWSLVNKMLNKAKM